MKTTRSIDDILDWQLHATTEAFLLSEKTGEPIKVHVTQELIDKHKSQAKQQLLSTIKAGLPKKKYPVRCWAKELCDGDMCCEGRTYENSAHNNCLKAVEDYLNELFGVSDE